MRLQLKTVFKHRRDVTRCTTETKHRVLFVGFELTAAQ
ncbi:Uncharacterised protein [Vibrio cholerae]|nr:Uncharacterised protein [Vibrio cholerae]